MKTLPQIIGFRSGISRSARVDADAGTITGIAVCTANMQPRGWPIWTDEKSLDTLMAACSARGRCKSYITHAGAPFRDRQGEEIGLFDSYRKEGAIFRADFAAMAAFRKHEQRDFDALFELAKDAPETFGVSPVFAYTLVWVRRNGQEIPTELASYRTEVPIFSPDIPSDSLTRLPCWRATEIVSIDFTDMPASNTALFSGRGGPPSAAEECAMLRSELRALDGKCDAESSRRRGVLCARLRAARDSTASEPEPAASAEMRRCVGGLIFG